MIHSELDMVNRVTEPEQLLVALRELGSDVKLVVFPDEGHSMPTTGSPKHRSERIKYMLKWFKKYLKLK
jgi:dipeptidyl aminopeptidase/acylaminoacyl peptidase